MGTSVEDFGEVETIQLRQPTCNKYLVRWQPGELLAPPQIPSKLQKTRRLQYLDRTLNSLCRKLHLDPHQHQRGWVPHLPDIDTTGTCILRTAAEKAGTVAGMPSSKCCGSGNASAHQMKPGRWMLESSTNQPPMHLTMYCPRSSGSQNLASGSGASLVFEH